MNAAQAATSGAAISENPAPESPRPAGFDYFNQVLPATHVVCGRTLKPLSIGRYRRTKRQGVAFVSDEEAIVEPSSLVGDLLKGVLICSMSCADYDSFISQPDAGKQITKWAQLQGFLPPRYLDWPIVGGWINAFVGKEVTQMRAEREAAYLLEQIRLFREYIIEAQKIPNYTKKQNSPQRNPLHWSNYIELHLRAEQNWTSEEIDEAPLSKGLADYFGFAEANGMISILTDADYEDIENNDAAIAKALAEWAEQQKAKD